jgi:hypothetical protein
MGLLYTTEGTRRILDTLNTAFSGPDSKDKGLQFIRDAVEASKKTEQKLLYNMILNHPWKRGHLATTLALLPYDQGKGGGINPADTARWAFFIKTVIGGKFNDLCKALSEAILDSASVRIVSVSFDHVEHSGRPNLIVYDAPLTNDLNGPYGRHITLFTRNLNPTGDTDKFDAPDPADGPPLNPPWKRP